MSLKINDIQAEVAYSLKAFNVENKSLLKLGERPLIRGKQCFYVMNWLEGRVSFSVGLSELLGYDNPEEDPYLGIYNFHPEDGEIVNRIINGITTHCMKYDISSGSEYLNLTYRLRHRDGQYLKVLRQTGVYEVDPDGRMVSNWSYLSDISFIDNGDKVEWDIHAPELDQEAFKEQIFKEFIDFFTKRELEVIESIREGLTNAQIAKKLFVSAHTVATHRKNIYRKSRCRSPRELFTFCEKNGIL